MNAILEQDTELFAQQFALKDELRKKTIAITGATGLLGACMVRCLLKLNSQQNLGLRILAVVRNIAKQKLCLVNKTMYWVFMLMIFQK